jgi:DNA-binding XRE family transcriptional regulator
MNIIEKLWRLTKLTNKQAVAREAGIHGNTLVSILSGKRNPSLPTARALARTLGVDLGWLVDDSRGFPAVYVENKPDLKGIRTSFLEKVMGQEATAAATEEFEPIIRNLEFQGGDSRRGSIFLPLAGVREGQVVGAIVGLSTDPKKPGTFVQPGIDVAFPRVISRDNFIEQLQAAGDLSGCQFKIVVLSCAELA